MSSKSIINNASPLSLIGRLAMISALAISSSLLVVNVQAADKAGDMKMGSMEMHKSMMSGMKGMESMKASGDTDHDFAMMMKMHHQSALDMANLELSKGTDPKLKSMAKAIIKSQTKEIMEFDKWLEKHERPMADAMPKSK